MALTVKSHIARRGVYSSEVTAPKNRVLAGFNTVTSDSNDAVVGGELPRSHVTTTYGGTMRKYIGAVETS